MAYPTPRHSLTSADVHFLSAPPGEVKESFLIAPQDCTLEYERPTEPITSDVSDEECDEDEEDSSEWLALELVQHLPQEKMSKLLSTMQRREKMLQDARKEKKVLLESCRRLKEENDLLKQRLLQDQHTVSRTTPLGSPVRGSASQMSPVKCAERPSLPEPLLARAAPALVCPEATGHEQARGPEAAPEETGGFAPEEEAKPPDEVMLKVQSGSAVRRIHISRFELSDVQAALQRFAASGRPVKAVIIVGDATSSRFEVQALNEKSWLLALAASRVAVESEPGTVPMVRLRLDSRGDLSAR